MSELHPPEASYVRSPQPTLQDVKIVALRFVNWLRELHHLGDPLDELPQGHRGSPGGCPIAMGLATPDTHGVRVSTESVYSLRERGEFGPISTPPAVAQFMRSFDQGAYPELELPPKVTP